MPTARNSKAPGPQAADETTEPDGHRTVFVISPIGDRDSDIRRRSDQILRHVITPVATEFGFKCIRADTIDQSGSITSQIINQVISADMVVADLTGHNPNVFYELAIRHAAAKPFVQLISEGETLPFDISNYRTIFIDHHDLDSVHEAILSLRAMFKEPDTGRADTPVTQAVDFEGLKASNNPETRDLAGLATRIDQLGRLINQTVPTRTVNSSDFRSLRRFVDQLSAEGRLTADDADSLITETTSQTFDRWVRRLHIVDANSDSRIFAHPRALEPDEPPF